MMILNNNDLNNTINNMPKGKKYDCLVPVSGGKDGTFILWYLKKHTDLHLIAYHIDNWYISPSARQNVEDVCKKLDVDLVTYRLSWQECKTIYRALLLKMGEICIACEFMIDVLPVLYALNNDIPNIAWGLTPNQLISKHISSGIENINYKFYYDLMEYYKTIFATVLNNEEQIQIIEKWFYFEKKYEEISFPKFLFPFYFLGYNAEFVEQTVSYSVDWKRSCDVGGTSSNCLINKLHIYIKTRLKGKEFYKKMLEKKRSNLEVTDEIVLAALQDINFDDVELFLKDLDISLEENELIKQIESFRKPVILRKESNISQ